MGYGEIGGGGSVNWQMLHGGNPGGGSGHDPDPPRGQGRFVVKINTGAGVQVVGPFLIQDDNPRQIQIVWSGSAGPEAAILEEEMTKAKAAAEKERQT
jgi:hypothetical protein